MMKRFLCLLCALVLMSSFALAEPEIILPDMDGRMLPVYEAVPRDFTAVVKPEMFNASGVAEKNVGKHNNHSVTFMDEAQLQWGPTSIFYNEYDGECEFSYELADSGEVYTEILPMPSTANAAASLASWMTFGWPGSGEIYPLQSEQLSGITLVEAKERAEALFAELGMEGYTCDVAIDMSLDRIREMGEKWDKLLENGELVSNYQPDWSRVTEADEGYLLRYNRFGRESDLGGQFYAELYVTAEDFASISISDQYSMGRILSTPEKLITWQEAAEALPKELADSRMQPEVTEILSARLAWCPVREKTSETGMAFTPAWVLRFDARNGEETYDLHAVFNAADGKFITGNWY